MTKRKLSLMFLGLSAVVSMNANMQNVYPIYTYSLEAPTVTAPAVETAPTVTAPAEVEAIASRLQKAKYFVQNAKSIAASYMTKEALLNGKDNVMSTVKMIPGKSVELTKSAYTMAKANPGKTALAVVGTAAIAGAALYYVKSKSSVKSKVSHEVLINALKDASNFQKIRSSLIAAGCTSDDVENSYLLAHLKTFLNDHQIHALKVHLPK